MIQPTENEIRATKIASLINELIEDTLKKSKFIPAIQFNIPQFFDKIRLILDIIYDSLKPGENVSSFYYLYLLQQVAQYNSFFIKKNDSPAIDQQVKDPNTQLQRINHPLLRGIPVKMSYDLENDNIFSPPHVETVNHNKCFFYQNPGSLEQCQQKIAHYDATNKKIGSLTQISNTKRHVQQAGQHRDGYFKPQEKKWHKLERIYFIKAIDKIRKGLALTDVEENVLKNGRYYRLNVGMSFRKPFEEKEKANKTTIQHIGHASELINISTQNNLQINIVIDPVHYQNGAGSNISLLGKLFYPRETEDAIKTNQFPGYPGVQVVLLSHNHYDHMCEKSIKEAFSGMNPLFIVPVGDGKYLKEWGFKHIVEISSWNQEVKVNLESEIGNTETIHIHSFPANHASNRGLNDYFESLYMGFFIWVENSKKALFLTGDTAVLSDQHLKQFEKYLLEKDLIIEASCIAHGPDRPRSLMACTHQSTADALVLQAKINLINLKVIQQRNKIANQNAPISFKMLMEANTYAMGYHQGCYRLGLLSYSDAENTILRILAVLEVEKNKPIDKISTEILKFNFYYANMDAFECAGLETLLSVYNQVNILENINQTIRKLTAGEVKELILTHLNLPQPGFVTNFDESSLKPHFVYDVERLIVNRQLIGKPHTRNAAFEDYIRHLAPSHYQNELIILEEQKSLVNDLLTYYIKRSLTSSLKINKVSDFLKNILQNIICTAELKIQLITLYHTITEQKKHDEETRQEGHFQTAMLIFFNLLYHPSFKQQCYNTYLQLTNNQPMPEGLQKQLTELSNQPLKNYFWISKTSDETPIQEVTPQPTLFGLRITSSSSHT